MGDNTQIEKIKDEKWKITTGTNKTHKIVWICLKILYFAILEKRKETDEFWDVYDLPKLK